MRLHKCWRALLNRVIAKQQSKREQAHPVCLQEVQKYKKVESVNTLNDYETLRKKRTDKKKTALIFVFCKCLNYKKTSSRYFERILGNENYINKKKKDLLEKPRVTIIIT